MVKFSKMRTVVAVFVLALAVTCLAVAVPGKWMHASLPSTDNAAVTRNPLWRWWQARQHESPDSPECMWLDYPRHDAVRAWEIQGQPHRHMIRNRDKAIRKMEALLQKLSDDPDSGVVFVKDSRWMAIFKEVSFQVSTRHGHPLHPKDEDEKHSCPFPWKGLGYLRLRQYKVLTPAGAYVPTAMPGMADLTFKMKKMDPDVGPGELELPKKVGDAKLTAKMEYDGHCDHGRISMSPLYKPVSQDINISRIANVKDYYPNLAKVAHLDANEPLPFMHEVHRAKVMWTVVFKGVIGEANLVIKYNTTLDDAVAGRNPKNGEISLRIRRDVAEATGTTGEEGKKLLFAGLDAIGRAMQVFRDNGWDGKTPSLNDHLASSKRDSLASSDSSSDDCGCDCKSCHCSREEGLVAMDGGSKNEAVDAADSSKCGCCCKCGCDCKHCDRQLAPSAAVTAGGDQNKCGCGCGCKCGCDCKHCDKQLAPAAAATAGSDCYKCGCGCGCKCGCDCNRCDKHLAPAAAATAGWDQDKCGCGCGCKCGCDCKHCDKQLASAAATTAGSDCYKCGCGCGCKCRCDCKHTQAGRVSSVALFQGPTGFGGMLPRPMLGRPDKFDAQQQGPAAFMQW